MVKWLIELFGDSSDLAMLHESFTGPDLAITERDGTSFMSGNRFSSVADAQTVRELATQIVTSLSGAAAVAIGSRRPLDIGAVRRVRADGKEDIFITPGPAVLRARAMPTTVGGTKPADPIVSWLPLATPGSAVAKALRLRSQGNLSWPDLYRLYEVVEHDVGGADQVVSNGWSTRAAIDRFKHTANSVAATGDNARHGVERTQPPSKPMKLSTARDMVDNILKVWLNQQTHGS